MRRLSGQVVRGLAVALHRFMAVLLTVAVALSIGIAALAWRLSQGPIEMPWLAQRIEAALDQTGGPRLQVRSAALAWEGFRTGLDSPLDVRLNEIVLLDSDGAARVVVPRAEVTLSLLALIRGRIEPRTVTVEQPSLIAQRAADGALSLMLTRDEASPDPNQQPRTAPELTGILAELAQPPANDASRGRTGDLSQIRRVRVEDATLTVIDRQLGITWHAPRADLDLIRQPDGGVRGSSDLVLALGDQQAQLHATVDLPAGSSEARAQMRLSPIAPTVLARMAAAGPGSALTPLSAFDLPVSIEAELTLGPRLLVRQMHLKLQAGAGTARLAGSTLPIEQAVLLLSGTPQHVALDTLRLVLPGVGGAPPATLLLNGTVQRDGARLTAALVLSFDHVAFAALPVFWPVDFGRDARAWIVENITSGIAHDGRFDLALTGTGDLSDMTVTGASGTLQADGLTVHWLRPVPPVFQGQATLRLVDADTVDIKVMGGQETEPNSENLALRGGRLRFTGLAHRDQDLTLQLQIAGSVPAAITLLRDPKLGLLSRHPIALVDPAGQMSANLNLSFPLTKRLTMDEVTIGVQAHLSGLHLSRVAAGHNLDQGAIDLSAGSDGMTLNGEALLAGIPAQLQASMDFRAGPPGQVVQRMTVSARPDTRQLAAAGLDASDVLAGPIPLSATVTERRNGTGTVEVKADLTPTSLSVEPLGWRKPEGKTAKADGVLLLDHDRLTGIDPIQLRGDGIDVLGRAELVQGHLTVLQVDRMVLGATSGRGLVQFPPGGSPISASLSGSTLDLSGRFGHRSPTPATGLQTGREATSPPGPSWTLDARFDRVILAGTRSMTNVSAHAEDDGKVLRDLRLHGLTGPGAPVLWVIREEPKGRAMTLSATDAGALLRAVDALDTMDGGRLKATATYDDRQAGRPLAGTAEIDDFRIRNAPAIGKLLEAVTLYGLVEALRGPGVGFSKLTAPFRLAGGILELTEVRAFSPSLGLTAKGSLDLDRRVIDLQGTIVPAYFFNSLLGRVPVFGRLFSPEQGGGVISASYALRGPMDDPTVTINPLTALTPGFLRGLFGIF